MSAAGTAMATPVLEVAGVQTYYGRSYVLQGVDLSVGDGQIVAVLGRNGVGKTTLMRSIIGFTPPASGHIRYRGDDIAGRSPERIARLGIALVPQGRRVFPSLTVGETLDIASHLKRHDKTGCSWPLERIYEVLPRLRERVDQRSGSLSGGEQQMLAVARALVGYPALLLLDEPTEGLSPLLVRELHRVLRRLKDEGVSMLLVEQQVRFALTLADHAYVMSKGRIVHSASARELLEDEAARHEYLGL